MSVRAVNSSAFAPPLTSQKIASRQFYQKLLGGSISNGGPVSNEKFAGNAIKPDSIHSPVVRTLKTAYLDEPTRIKAKIYSTKWTCTGEKLAVATRENVVIVNPYNLTAECAIATPAMGVLPHPKHPDIISVLSYDKPALKIYDFRCHAHEAALAVPLKGSGGSSNRYKDKGPAECVDVKTSTGSLISGAWSPDGSTIVVSDRMDVIQAIDMSFPVPMSVGMMPCADPVPSLSGKLGVRSPQQEAEVGMVCFDNFGELLFVTKQDGMIDVYPAKPLSLNPDDKISLQVHHGYVYNATCDPTGSLLATSGLSQIINIVDIDTLSSIGSLPKIDGTVSSLSFSHTGEFLAWGTKEGSSTYNASSRTSSGVASGTSNDGAGTTGDWCVSIGGVDPCEIYRTFSQAAPVVSVAWHPHRNILCFACETNLPISGAAPSNEYFMTPSSYSGSSCSGEFWSNKGPKPHPIGFISIE